MGPLAGVAFNLTLLSYNGSLDMGLNIDAAAVAEPDPAATGFGDLQRPSTNWRRREPGQDLPG